MAVRGTGEQYQAGDKASLQEFQRIKQLWYYDGTPGDNDDYTFYVDTSAIPWLLKGWDPDGTPQWRTVSLVPPASEHYFNGVSPIDDNNDIIFQIETPSTITTAHMALYGYNFPSYFYTELGEHTHDAGHTHTFDPDQSLTSNKDLSTHGHGDNFAVANENLSTHRHGDVSSGGDNTSYTDLGSHNHSLTGGVSNEDLGNHYHAFDGSGTTDGPSASGTWATDAEGVNGGSLSTVQKTTFTGSNLRIYATTDPSAWGTAWGYSGATPDLSGLFATSGTGLVDISSKIVTVSDIYFIKIVCNEAAKGAMINWMVKIS